MSNYNLEQAKLIPIQDILYKHGSICPKCSHALDIGYTNRCRCNKCGTNYSSVDLIQALYNTSVPRAIEILTGHDIRPVKQEKINQIINQYKEKQQKEQKHRKQVNNMIFKNCIEPTSACLSYLESRNIKECISTLNNDYIEIKSNIYNDVETIIYRFKKQGTGIQKALIKNEDGKRFIRNIGTVRPVFHKAYENNKYVIVEGIEDALSCHMLGYNFICLNSISNTGNLIDIIKKNIEKFKNIKLLICTDYDKGGLDSFEQLEKFFASTGLIYDIAPFYEDIINYRCKDVNEYYVKVKNKRKEEIKVND